MQSTINALTYGDNMLLENHKNQKRPQTHIDL